MLTREMKRTSLSSIGLQSITVSLWSPTFSRRVLTSMPLVANSSPLQFTGPPGGIYSVKPAGVIELCVSGWCGWTLCVWLVWLDSVCPAVVIGLCVSGCCDWTLCVRLVWLDSVCPAGVVGLCVSGWCGWTLCVRLVWLSRQGFPTH